MKRSNLMLPATVGLAAATALVAASPFNGERFAATKGLKTGWNTAEPGEPGPLVSAPDDKTVPLVAPPADGSPAAPTVPG